MKLSNLNLTKNSSNKAGLKKPTAKNAKQKTSAIRKQSIAVVSFILCFLTFAVAIFSNFIMNNASQLQTNKLLAQQNIENSLSGAKNYDVDDSQGFNNINTFNRAAGLMLNSAEDFNAALQNGNQVENVKNLADDIYFSHLEKVKNRTAGSDGEKAFAEILATKLAEMNFTFLDDAESYIQIFSLGSGASQNVIGVLDNASENFVVLGAHLDSVYKAGASYGFHDNLSGVLGVLMLAEQLKQLDISANIIVAFYGAEEVGCKGSEYFVKNLSSNIKNNIMLSINFDSIGSGEKLYYFHSDYSTTYGKIVDNFAKDENFRLPGLNKHFSTLVNLNINYTSLGLLSDNSSFLKEGINALTFFAGNLDATNGLGYFEKQGHDKIMHNTDSAETNLNVFGDVFYENIISCVNFAANLINDDQFNIQNFKPSQINVVLYSVWVLKIVGVLLILIILVLYFIVLYKKYPKRGSKKYLLHKKKK